MEGCHHSFTDAGAVPLLSARDPESLPSCPPKVSPAGNVTLEERWQQDGVFFREGRERQVKRLRSKPRINSMKQILDFLK